MDFESELSEYARAHAERQKNLGSDLLRLWDEGRGDLEATDKQARLMRTAMRGDEAKAREHIEALETVAAGTSRVPTAHLILHDFYRRGWGVSADAAKSLWHLERAIECGDVSARWFLGSYLLGDEKLAPALPKDAERGLKILRRVANHSTDHSSASLARGCAASYLIKNFTIHEVSHEDRELIDAYAADRVGMRYMDQLHLARFYAGAATDHDYAGAQYHKARELLIAGSKSTHDKVRDACNAQLEAWGVRPGLEPVMTTSQKAGAALKTTGVVGGIGLVMWGWSMIGLALLSVAAMINAFMVPIILVAVAVALVVKVVRR